MVSPNDYLYFLRLMTLATDMCYIETNDGMSSNVTVTIVRSGLSDYYLIQFTNARPGQQRQTEPAGRAGIRIYQGAVFEVSGE